MWCSSVSLLLGLENGVIHLTYDITNSTAYSTPADHHVIARNRKEEGIVVMAWQRRPVRQHYTYHEAISSRRIRKKRGLACVHWTCWMMDTCPRVDMCSSSNVSSRNFHWTQVVSKKEKGTWSKAANLEHIYNVHLLFLVIICGTFRRNALLESTPLLHGSICK